MDEKGVYGVARAVWECEAFMRQKFTQREAWLWLVGAAVWKQTKVNIEGRWVILERSEFCYSSRFLAKKWRWKKDAVLRFMKHLKSEAMIRARECASDRDSIPVYSICKYNEFQVVGLPGAPASAPEDAPLNAPALRQPCAKEEALQTLEEKEDKKRSPALRVVPPKPLPDWLPLEAWSAFLAMRRKIKKVPTDYAIDLLLAKLEKFRLKGHDPTEVLDYSTQNNYPGIFEPKAERNGQRRQSSHETAYSVARDYCAEILAGGQGSQGGGTDEAPLPLLPAGSNRGPNTGRN